MAVTINGGTGVTIGSGAAYTFGDGSTQTVASDPADFAFKNRIINGAMVIDQRNAGASISLSGSAAYPVDRMVCYGRASGAGMTGQRSTVAPAGFTNSLLFTATTGVAPVGGDYAGINQNIEGFNFADLGWGTANAQTVALSFWVRSSVTGTYGFAIQNSAQNRSYVAQYTVNAANTWEYKTVTITGDTSGTWLTDNGVGARLTWDMGYGFGSTATANAWQAGNFYSVTGNIKLGSTAGATFYITGVQLEKNTGATGFDVRPYGTELSLCQRYCYRIDGAASASIATGAAQTAAIGIFTLYFPVQARVAPTGIVASSAWILNNFGPGSSGTTTPSFLAATTNGMTITIGGGGSMNVGSAGQVYSSGAAGYIYTSGSEL